MLPDHYPLDEPVESHLAEENPLARTLHYGVIGSRVQALYDWSAPELGINGLPELVRDGNPIYAWPYDHHQVWAPARGTAPIRLVRRATKTR
ncbi:MAG: hypothetical protein ACRDPE_18670 [Solirubrobacterales bacterium]